VENLEQRFWAKVDESAGPDACWPWTASQKDNGRPQFRVHHRGPGGGVKIAYRVAFELAQGHWPDGDLHHLCENELCCNPTHLVELGRDEHVEGHLRQGKLFERGEA
jgi:hypothetical protein